MSECIFDNKYTDVQLRSKARILGIKKTRSFNNDYFNIIDNCNKAYILGFIYADGCLVYNKKKRNYEISLEINRDDRYLLELFNFHLGNVHKIKDRYREDYICGSNKISKRHTSTLRIYSKKICEALITLNVLPDKTNKLEFPTNVGDFFISFLRGFFDGDGCVWQNKGNLYVKFTNSNRLFLMYIKNKLQEYDIYTALYKENNKKYNLVVTRINDVKKIYDLLYSDKSNLYLLRKKDKFENWPSFTEM